MNMNTKKLTAIFLSALLLAALAASQTATQKKKAGAAPAEPSDNLPSRIQIEAAMTRNFGYDPAVTWQIYEVREAPIPGMADVLLSMNKQAPVHLYISADGQNAIVGELIPFGPNPFAPARQKLKAADGPARGPQAPVISMIEFSDLECPHCKAAQPILEKLAADFPQVRY